MAYYAFGQNDLLHNVLETNPRASFYIYSNNVYRNNFPHMSGSFTGSVLNVPPGHVNLFEYNVDRNEETTARAGGTGMIRPFTVKDGSLSTFKSISKQRFDEDFQYGDIISGSYPMSASISREFFEENHELKRVSTAGCHLEEFKDLARCKQGGFDRVNALKNTLNYYSYLSEHYTYNYPSDARRGVASVLPGFDEEWNKGYQEVNLVSIPSIMYGDSIKKGSVELNFYISGTLAGQLKDINKNGELIQVTGAANAYGTAQGSGSVAGVVLYNEGFILLTGSWPLDDDHTEGYTGGSAVKPKWIYWGAGAETGSYAERNTAGVIYTIPSSSFALTFSGSHETNVLTMFAHARRGRLNHSNNPTYMAYSQSIDPLTASAGGFYREPDKNIIKNTVSGAFSDLAEDFQKQTFISKIKIYDDDMNCIGIAKVATPVKKTLERDLTFKLKIDI